MSDKDVYELRMEDIRAKAVQAASRFLAGERYNDARTITLLAEKLVKYIETGETS